MECKYCKSSWNSSMVVTNCPFCGKNVLIEANDNMTFQEGIRFIVTKYGVDILNDSRRLIALIMDYVRGCDKEKKLFKIACDCGILKMSVDIKECQEEQRTIAIQKAIRNLEENAFLSSENAEYIVSLIMEGLNIPYVRNKKDVQPKTAEVISQKTQEKLISKTTENSMPTNTISDEEYLRNIVVTNATSSKEEREKIFEIGRKNLINNSIDDGFKYVQYATKRGSMQGAILLGYCYDVGLGVKQDKKVAEAYYRQGTLSNPEFKKIYEKNGIGRGLFEAAAKAAERMLKVTYMSPKTTDTVHEADNTQIETKKDEILQKTSSGFFQAIKGKIFRGEKDKEERLWTIVNTNRRPTKEECSAILNLGRKLLKSGNTADGITLIRFISKYGYDYGVLLMGYCYDNGIGVGRDYNVASAYYSRAGVSGSAEESYKKYSWDDKTQRARAYTMAEKIYYEKV